MPWLFKALGDYIEMSIGFPIGGMIDRTLALIGVAKCISSRIFPSLSPLGTCLSVD